MWRASAVLVVASNPPVKVAIVAKDKISFFMFVFSGCRPLNSADEETGKFRRK
jgi:uncharacterized ParB-like nuclease family protein